MYRPPVDLLCIPTNDQLKSVNAVDIIQDAIRRDTPDDAAGENIGAETLGRLNFV